MRAGCGLGGLFTPGADGRSPHPHHHPRIYGGAESARGGTRGDLSAADVGCRAAHRLHGPCGHPHGRAHDARPAALLRRYGGVGPLHPPRERSLGRGQTAVSRTLPFLRLAAASRRGCGHPRSGLCARHAGGRRGEAGDQQPRAISGSRGVGSADGGPQRASCPRHHPSPPPDALLRGDHRGHPAGHVRISGRDHPGRGEHARAERAGTLPEPEGGRAPLRVVPGAGPAAHEIHTPGNGQPGLHAADRLGRQSLASLLRPGGQPDRRSAALAADHHRARPHPLRFGLSLPARRRGCRPTCSG